MSEVVYLLGAGASAGERESLSTGNKKIKSGLPIVNELSVAIESLIKHLKAQNPGSEPICEKVYEELKWLKEKCQAYPTIDTYAKKLFVTGCFDEFNKIKRALSIFFTLFQEHDKRDQRYDGFIASIIKNDGTFPDSLSILSWNYDCQLDYVLKDFSYYRNYTELWGNSNLLIKGRRTFKFETSDFNIVKLNGTALLSTEGEDKLIPPNNYSVKTIADRLDRFDMYYKTNLSFAWEEDSALISKIKPILKDVNTLVIIGYSFPYVNREIDRAIINNMPKLQNIYIQDKYADGIKDSVESVFDEIQDDLYSKGQIKIKTKNSTRQFYIPRELK